MELLLGKSYSLDYDDIITHSSYWGTSEQSEFQSFLNMAIDALTVILAEKISHWDNYTIKSLNFFNPNYHVIMHLNKNERHMYTVKIDVFSVTKEVSYVVE